MTLLPPTAVTLGELAGHPDVAAILARRRSSRRGCPSVIVRTGGCGMALPQSGEERT